MRGSRLITGIPQLSTFVHTGFEAACSQTAKRRGDLLGFFSFFRSRLLLRPADPAPCGPFGAPGLTGGRFWAPSRARRGGRKLGRRAERTVDRPPPAGLSGANRQPPDTDAPFSTALFLPVSSQADRDW